MLDKKIRIELENKYSNMEIDELMQIASAADSDYEPEAIGIATAELKKRNVSEDEITKLFAARKENKPIKNEKKKEVFSGLQCLLWWKIEPKELERQVEDYKTLKITDSARGVSFLFCILASIITFIFFYIINADKYSSIDSIIFLVLGFLIYKGQRWAIIITMILWTMEKSFYAYDALFTQPFNAVKVIMQIAFWCVFMHAFYVALKVENLRRKETGKITIADGKKSLS